MKALATDPELKRKASLVNRRLKKEHPDAHCELNFSTPEELLVATILSAQCTDKRVNIVTEKLFKVFKTPESYLKKPVSELESIIKSTGFFRQKAKSIRGAMKALVEKYDGKAPKKMAQLVELPGVGRKTANVVLGNGYGIPGLPVDTHVTRLSNRIGLSETKDAVKLEHQLNAMLDKRHWTLFSLRLIFHGRRVCPARTPKCDICCLTDICEHYQNNNGKN